MGLLDALFSGGGQGGGLLDLIRQGQPNYQMGNLPSDQAQYSPMGGMAQAPQFAPQQNAQPSPLDNAQWPYGPNGAPSQSNAQMIPQQPPPVMQAPPMQPQQPQGPGIGDRLGAGFQSFANSGGPLQAIVNGIGGAITGHRMDDHGIAQQQLAQIQNLTQQWLQQRGVDPIAAQAAIANPEVLKSLIEQLKPKTPMNMGSGYIYEPDTKKATRLYEPDEKTPAGFVKDEKTGAMHYVPGGPADPAYARDLAQKSIDPNEVKVAGRGAELYTRDANGKVTIVHKNEETPIPMDPDAVEILARREIGGDFSGRKNLGRGAQGAADLRAITNKSSEILTKEMGMSPTDAAAHLMKQQQQFAAQGQGLNSEARTTGVREANLNLILKAADAAIPAALEASDKVDRTGWVPLNKIIQGGEVIASNPDLKKFGMANLQLAEHWARAMNPTGVMRESDRDKALSFLSTADSKDTYKAAVGQLRTQIERERDAVRSTRGMSSMPGITPETTQAGAPKPGAYVWSPNGGVQPK